MAETSIFPVFHSGVGYGIIVGLGGLFAILMTLTTFALRRYFSEVQDSEMHLTAKRSIKAGLIASSVVSSWTLSATLLTSTTFGYSFGAGCSIPILTFAVLAIELKRKAPNAHTFLELVKHRYGAPGHIVLAIYSLIYQIFIAVNLLVGGADVFNLVTGMNKVAVCFLFPLGVCIYTLFGGIKATFLTEWVHTVIIFVIMLSSMFVIYATSEHVGSPGRMWELLKAAAEIRPVEGNAGGELLTMRSISGGLIGLIFLGGGFSATVDSQPTYPTPLSAAEINSALIMPYTAYTIMGKGGVVAVLLMLFQAITSAMSSETVAVTSLVTYDFYRSYINPNATGKQLIFISHIAVLGFGLLTASIAVGLCYAGFSVTFIVTAIGIIIDGAVIPNFKPTVAGNMLALTAPIILTPLITYIKPDNYDFEKFKELQQVDDSDFDPKVQNEGASVQDAQQRTYNELVNLERIEKPLLHARNFALAVALFISISMTM
ncbi:hypothetical protein G7Z17_g459 [Cylindrodendrum hubeiense]|uniref:Uncharacterized protein n=1 Tax=Cylindrodendrum hubeiense TaxID=595255 RepID=A0A9P5HGU8_9HYPO|nr:hypothetical protein G7Z17_g459 [Cylindrodendrum hubeiense]